MPGSVAKPLILSGSVDIRGAECGAVSHLDPKSHHRWWSSRGSHRFPDTLQRHVWKRGVAGGGYSVPGHFHLIAQDGTPTCHWLLKISADGLDSNISNDPSRIPRNHSGRRWRSISNTGLFWSFPMSESRWTELDLPDLSRRCPVVVTRPPMTIS